MHRRTIGYGLGILLLIGGLLPVGTHLIFLRFEDKYLTYHESLLFVIETLTTTGYGELVPFAALVTTLWSGAVMAVGFFVLSVWLGSLMSAWLSQRFQLLPPRRAPRRLRGHVIIYGTGSIGGFLARHLQELQVPYMVLGDDKAALGNLLANGLSVMEVGKDKVKALQLAGLRTCRAVVAARDDRTNAEVCLIAQALRPSLPRLCTVDQPENETLLQVAGATVTVVARHALGERLAWLLITPLTSQWEPLLLKAQSLAICQIPILPGSAFDGQTLQTLRLRERTGATILGRWLHGHFAVFLRHDIPLRAGQVLVAAGSHTALDQLRTLVGSRVRSLGAPVRSVLVIGGGEVGIAAVRALEKAGVAARVLDLAAKAATPNWFQGDATHPSDLRSAGIMDVEGCVIAIGDDTAAVFATMVARQLNPNLHLLVRASAPEVVPSIYLAGADHVLSLSEVVGAELEYLSLPPGVVPAEMQTPTVRAMPVPPSLVRKRVASIRVGTRSSCYLVAVETANGHMELSPTGRRRLRRGETLFLFGTLGQLEQFKRTFT